MSTHLKICTRSPGSNSALLGRKIKYVSHSHTCVSLVQPKMIGIASFCTIYPRGNRLHFGVTVVVTRAKKTLLGRWSIWSHYPLLMHNRSVANHTSSGSSPCLLVIPFTRLPNPGMETAIEDPFSLFVIKKLSPVVCILLPIASEDVYNHE